MSSTLHVAVFGTALLVLGICGPAKAVVITTNFDSSVAAAPAGFTTAFEDAASFFESTYADPITINLNVGWGEIDGSPVSPGALGQSLTNQQGFFDYSQVAAALKVDARSQDDATAIASLPASDPTGGKPFIMADAEAKALGLLAGNSSATDGWVGFNSSVSYSFDPDNRAVPNEFDFVGIAEHEISEVMGRYGITQNGCADSTCLSPIDLFRYSAPGVRALAFSAGTYFSIDAGAASINSFDGASGDFSDWLGLTNDAFNAELASGAEELLSAGDVTVMDVIGYDLNAAPIPEPSTLALMLSGILIVCPMLWRRANRGRTGSAERIVLGSDFVGPQRISRGRLKHPHFGESNT